MAAFFQWQAEGAAFEIVELDITEGDRVAYAYTLLRCGTEEELANDPGTTSPDYWPAQGWWALDRCA